MNDNRSLSILRKKGFRTLEDLVGVLPQRFTAVTPKKSTSLPTLLMLSKKDDIHNSHLREKPQNY